MISAVVPRRIGSALVLALLAAGCGDDPVSPSNPAEVKQAWIGSYADPSWSGDLVIDITRTGTDAKGEIVFGSPTPTHLWVRGVLRSDSLLLAPDPDYGTDPAEFSLRAQVLSDGSLSGTMALVSQGLSADLSCRVLERRAVVTNATYTVPYTVMGMVHDGTHLWLGTVNDDYVRITSDGTVVDTVVIILERLNAHWTSDALMFNGTSLRGVYPVTVQTPGGLIEGADLYSFTASGRTGDSTWVGHRPVGLAYGGFRSWSLRMEPPALIAFDSTGTTLDSLHVGIPDPTRLAFDGTRFWTLGWYLRRLYELDANGQVLALCDLPSPATGTTATGLGIEGGTLWYGETKLGGVTYLRNVTVR